MSLNTWGVGWRVAAPALKYALPAGMTSALLTSRYDLAEDVSLVGPAYQLQ
jgi:hypothetical protein